MNLRVLGCHGGELPNCRSTCFLVDGVMALDAGSLTSTLSLEELCKVDDIVLTHSHFDHVKDLPMMADLIVGRRSSPVNVHSSEECIATLRKNMFNNVLWPDFTAIPDRKNPVLRLKPFKSGSSFKVGRYTFKSIPVDHPVESCGFVISDGHSSLGMSGDTGPTEQLWKVLNKGEELEGPAARDQLPQQAAAAGRHLGPTHARKRSKANSGSSTTERVKVLSTIEPASAPLA